MILIKKLQAYNMILIQKFQVYNMILILLCTVQAVKARKIPENFNEAKYSLNNILKANNMFCCKVYWLHHVFNLYRLACIYPNFLWYKP